jgi:DNA-binding MarR family transcriptional regulator
MRKVSDEIKQERPFDRPERELAVTLLRTGDVLHHAVESVLRPWGVSPEQYNVLRILRGAKEGAYPAVEIARRMVARSPNITRMIDKMAAKGLTQRERADVDRRVVRVSITPEGRRVLGELDHAVNRLLTRLGFLSPAQARSLVDQLNAVRERLGVPTAREGGRGRKQAWVEGRSAGAIDR